MRNTILAAFVLGLLLLPATADARTGPNRGPFVGTVTQGETDSHGFSTHGGNPCLAIYIPTLYVVTLTYVPPTDTLTLSAHGLTAAGSLGTAQISFIDNYCTAFTIRVGGTAVASTAAYAVTVESVTFADVSISCEGCPAIS